MVNLDNLVKKLLFIFSLLLLTFFLVWHYQMSITRYFDVDEFAHLSWTSHWVRGVRPYIDFLTFFPPGFMVILTPLFLLKGVVPILAGRFLMFLVFLGILGATGYLFRQLRKSWVWIVAIVILAFLPLPKDKFIEIRPDNAATLLGLLGIIFQIRWFRKKEDRDGVIAGIFHAASLLVLPKMVPQVGVAVILALAAAALPVGETKEGKEIRGKLEAILPFIIGLLIPTGLFAIWALSLGDLGTVIYSLTKLPVEANKISQYFIMLPNLFFYPNGIFYGENEYPLGLKVNHFLWIVGMGVGAYRLVTPFLTRGRQYIYEELLVSGIFYVHIIFYVLIVPLKHTQYLIPIAVFVAWYAADLVDSLWQRMRRSKAGLGVFVFLGILGGVTLYRAYFATNSVKLTWTNAKALSFLTELYKTIPTSEYILDLDGRTLYYPYPYYACCIPFGQSSEFLTRALPSLPEALEKTGTKYIYQGELNRVTTLRGEDQAYINAHYKPVNGDTQLLVRNEKE